MRLAARACFTGILCLMAGVASAQYTAPGGPEPTSGDSREEALRRSMEEARFRLGPVRIEPWLSVRDIAWIETGTGTEDAGSDLTGTVGAGLRGFLRTGDLIWVGQVLPEYVWWREDEDRRALNGRYGLTAHGFWNRMNLEAGASREEQQQVVTPELLLPAPIRQDQALATVELLWTNAFSTLIEAHTSEQTSQVDADEADGLVPPGAASSLFDLRLLDRRETTWRTALRLRVRDSLLVGVGAEHYEAEFAPAARTGGLDRSNSGLSPYLEIGLERPGFVVDAEVVQRSLEAEKGSRFAEYDRTTGSLTVRLNPGGRVETRLYGERSFLYSLLPEYSYIDDDRLGAAFDIELGWRTRARFFLEGGKNSYTILVPGAPPREDDHTSYGGSFEFDLGRAGSLELRASRVRFDSTVPAFDRELTSVGAALTFTGGD